MAFTKSETNPNAAVGGGCIGIGGVRGYDCCAPFYTAEAVIGLNSTCPRIVICEYHRGELNRLGGAEAIPAGYGTELPEPKNNTPISNDTQTLPKPRRRAPKPPPGTPEALSL